MPSIVARLSLASDVPAIDQLCKDLYYREPGASVLLETALLCLTAIDTEQDVIVGFLCLHDGPTLRFGARVATEALEWLSSSPQAKVNPSNTAYVWVSAFHSDYEVAASVTLLKAAININPSIQRLLMATDGDITFTELGLASVFMRVASGAGGVVLYEAQRSSVQPPLTIRQARVEDHDDMVPILQAADARYPALAKLPESSQPEEPFALARVVGSQDDHNTVLVAMEANQMVGFMVVTSEVDTSALQDAFDLHPFDNFLASEEYDAQWEAARQSVYVKKANTLKAKLGSRAKDQEAQTEGEAGPDEAAEGAGEEEEEKIDLEAAARPSDEETKEEMTLMFGGQAGGSDPTIFAITMLCMDAEYEAQTLEFLQAAFDAFPDKMYCVLTLPHDSPEPPLVRRFTRVPPLPGVLFPEVLYLFNRHALMDEFVVRLAKAEDAAGVSMLVSGMPNSTEIQELFSSAQERGTAVVAEVSGEVVGLCTISPRVDLALLEANFMVSNAVYLPHHSSEWHAEIDMFCMNPIFSHRHRELLSGVQRLLKRNVLYYALPPGQAAPDMIEVLQQVAPRHRWVPSELQADFALYVFTRRNAFSLRRGVNAQIVVVGASETGLAAIERLLMDTEHNFNYITLLAPGGITVGGLACEYTASVIAKLGLEARVSLLDAELVGLDRESRMIELSDGSQLAYDLLLVTAGLQEQTCNMFSEADPDVAGSILSALELSSDFSIGDAAAMERIMVYGDTLDSYHALHTLEARGAASKSNFYCAPSSAPEPLVAVLRAAAGKMGVDLPQPEPVTIKELNSIIGDVRTRAVLQRADAEEGQGEERAKVDLVVGCRPTEASQIIFLCLNNSGVVYDGRVVVDGAFRTSDPQIYAAGSIAKLSRRYGANVHFQHYNSREVGTALGDSVVSGFQAPVPKEQPAPPLHRAKVVGCNVVGGLMFMYAGCPRAMAAPSLEPPHAGGKALATLTERGFMQINLDPKGLVYSVVYLGRVPIQVQRLTALVGLHVSYLHNLEAKHASGEAKDLISYVTGDTAPFLDGFMHDQFAAFRESLLASSLAAAAGGAKPSALMSAAQEAALEFVRTHARDLTQLHLPTPA